MKPRKFDHADIIAAIILIFLLGRPFGNLVPKMDIAPHMAALKQSIAAECPTGPAKWTVFRQ